jgi:hypothetical protein
MTTAFKPGEEIGEPLKPLEESGTSIQDLVDSMGWQVAGVDWIFTQVTGESLVSMVIEPITGDYRKINAHQGAWDGIAEALKATSSTMDENVKIVREDWGGNSGIAHEAYVRAAWKAGLYADAGLAKLVGKGFQLLGEASEKLARQALKLLQRAINKLLEAIAEVWAPIVGWVAVCKIVWDAYQIYQQILAIIDLIKDVVTKVKDLWTQVKAVGSQIAKIKDVRSIGDLVNVGSGIATSVSAAKDDIAGIKNDATGMKDAGSSIKSSAQDAAGNVGTAHTGVRNTFTKPDTARAKEMASNVVPSIRTEASAAKDDFNRKWRNDDGSIKWPTAADARTAATNAKNSAVDSVTGAAKDAYQERVGQYVDAAKQAKSDVQNTDYRQKYADAKDAVRNAPAAAREQVDNARSTVSETYSNARDSVRNFDAGQTISDARQSASEQVDNAKDAYRHQASEAGYQEYKDNRQENLSKLLGTEE